MGLEEAPVQLGRHSGDIVVAVTCLVELHCNSAGMEHQYALQANQVCVQPVHIHGQVALVVCRHQRSAVGVLDAHHGQAAYASTKAQAAVDHGARAAVHAQGAASAYKQARSCECDHRSVGIGEGNSVAGCCGADLTQIQSEVAGGHQHSAQRVQGHVA